MQSIAPPLIAVVSSGGLGKPAVCEYLITVIEKYSAAKRVHLEKQVGGVGRSVTRLSLMGRSLHKTIERNQVKIAKKLPGSVPALVITAFVAHRLLHFHHMLAYHRRGLIILTDRYPQNQIPGTCDGTVFPLDVESGRFVSWLASQERKAFHWMTNHKPDLVIKLNVDLGVACARKSDYKRESLARKIAITPQLTFGGVQLIGIDTNQPLEKMLIDAGKAITDFMITRGYHQ